MTLRRLPRCLFFAAAAVISAFDLYHALSLYPSLPEKLTGGLGKPAALFVPILSCVTWLLLLLAAFRAKRLLLPLPFREDAMNEAREALGDTLGVLALFSGAGFLTGEIYLLKSLPVPGWLYALLFLLLFLTAAYLAFAVIRIAKKHGVLEREVSEAEANAAWDEFIKNKK